MAENYQSDLSVWKMVLNRLPFLADTANNKTLVSSFIFELMHELEGCFGIDADKAPADPSKIGDEQYYSIPQRAVVADLTAVYILMLRLISNTAGAIATSDTVAVEASEGKYLKKVKAGSVETEWGVFDLKTSVGMFTDPNSMMGMYKASAIRKAYQLGCNIDILEGGAIMAQAILDSYTPPMFVVVTSCSNGIGVTIPERDFCK